LPTARSSTPTTVLKNATVYDGTGADPFPADVRIADGRIDLVGEVVSAAREIDATGLAVAPGFIDVHTHDDFAAVVHPDMGFKVRGGVTTCVVGNCGMGCAPFSEASLLARVFHPNAKLPPWEGHRGYLAYLDEHPPGTNVAVLAGHGSLRLAAMGVARSEPTGKQMRRMKSDLEEGLDAGVVGLSTGLIYEPSKYGRTEELIELAGVMRGTGALYASHMRDEGLGLLDSVRETIRIGEQAGVAVQISHHKASGRRAWGLVSESLRLIEAAQERGLEVHADQYPYTAGSTVLSAVLSQTVGANAPLRLADVVIASAAGHPDWEGQSLPSLATKWGVDAAEAGRRALAEEPMATVVLHTMDEEDVRTVLRHPSTMIGSDGIPILEGKPHPRLFGTFARILGRYSRELGLLSLPEAIHRMTGFPARKFGLVGRGVVCEGAAADLVVFDPATVRDTGTFEDPIHYPEGIVHVFVNGVHTVRDGGLTGATAGRALRRPG